MASGHSAFVATIIRLRAHRRNHEVVHQQIKKWQEQIKTLQKLTYFRLQLEYLATDAEKKGISSLAVFA